MQRDPIPSTDETQTRTVAFLMQLALLNEDAGQDELEALRQVVANNLCSETFAGPSGGVRVSRVGRNILFDGPGGIFVAFKFLSEEGEDTEEHSLSFLIFLQTHTPMYLE